MPASTISLIPVRTADLAVGKPLPFAIYDWHGKLLLAAGRIVESAEQLEEIADNGFMHDPAWDIDLSPRRPPARKPLQSQRKAAAIVPEEDVGERDREVVVAMDDVRWTVGEALYLQQVDSPSIRYTVRLIGFVKNKTVLTTAPAADGKVVLVRDGQTFVARAFSGKKAYAFVASAEKSVYSPYPYLHLSYPKEVRCTVVRRGARAEVRIAAAVSMGEQARSIAVALTDLSMGGASVSAPAVLGEKGAEGYIKFKINAAGQHEYLSLRANLRSIAPTEQGDGYRHGFEFLDVPMHARLILSAYVHQILAEGE